MKQQQPNFIHLLGRGIGTRWYGRKGVDLLLRLLHNPEQRQHSWMETVAPSLPDGPQFHLSTRWFTEWTTWFYGAQDPDIQRWIIGHAKLDWVTFDIGTNFGSIACLLGQRCSAVHGFEPVPWLARRARANVALNHYNNVCITETALSALPGEAELNLPSEEDCNWGKSSLVHRSSGKKKLKVTLDTVDNYVDREKLGRVDFIKIDVEGAEDLVLKGAARTLEAHHPAIIIERNNESVEEVVKLLEPLGYKFLDLSGNHLGEDFNKWPRDFLALAAA